MKPKMPHHRPWFLKKKSKLGEWSHLWRGDLNELLETVTIAVAEASREHRHLRWKRIKEAALLALWRLARRHHCTSERNVEGGDICFYYHHKPVFALRIGGYSDSRVTPQMKGKALYRGIVDILDWRRFPPPDMDGLSREDKMRAILQQQLRELAPVKVFYYMLPVRGASKWREREAYDLLRIIDCLKEEPGCSARDVQIFVHMNPNKTLKLLSWLEKRRIVYRCGRSVSTGFYLNKRPKWEQDSGSKSSSDSSESSSG